MSFPRYRRYKDTNVQWLGKVPEHWDVGPLRRYLEAIESGTSVNAFDVPAGPGEIGVLKTSCVYSGAFDAEENKTVVSTERELVSCPLSADVLIVSRMNTPDLVGAAGYVECAPANLYLPDRLWQITPKHVSARFLHYWTLTPEYRAQVEAACAGTSASMKNLAQDDFRAFFLAVPLPQEDFQITEFLDAETRKIDSLIAGQQRLIALLKEKRQAVISHAVTKGLHAATLKESGVTHLGCIPQHWTVLPLMRLTPDDRQIMYGIVLPGPHVENGVPIVKGGDVKAHRLNVDTLSRTTRDIEAGYARSRLKGGDIVYSIRGSIGEAAMVPDSLAGANLTQDAARVAPKRDIHGPWLLCALQADEVFRQLDEQVTGATIRGINIWALKRAMIPTPPLSEQKEIAEFVRRESLTFDELVNQAERAIALLRERRTALISAVVTGKIDVRHPADAEAA